MSSFFTGPGSSLGYRLDPGIIGHEPVATDFAGAADAILSAQYAHSRGVQAQYLSRYNDADH